MPILVPTPPTDGEAIFPSLSLARAGVELWLTRANGWYVLRGIEGLDNPPVSLLVDEPATWDGGLFRDARYAPREVFIPLHLQADDNAELRDAVRDLASLLDPKRGAVTLTVNHPDGRTRSIDGYLAAPLGQALGAAEAMTWRRMGLSLRCPDPFWTGEESSTSLVVSSALVDFLGDPFLPLAVSDSQVAGTLTVNNSGDADAYPVWTVTGPASTITIDVDGRTWSTSSALGAGEVLTVDTRRGAQSVDVDGTAAWGRLAAGADLAPFPPGTTGVGVDITGATDDTVLEVTWSQKWLTAW